MEIKKLDVPSYLHPMAAINWIMNSYTAGLPGTFEETIFVFDDRRPAGHICKPELC